jgi:hypothetical protein
MAPVDDGYVDMDPVQRYHGEGEMRGELTFVSSGKEMVVIFEQQLTEHIFTLIV